MLSHISNNINNNNTYRNRIILFATGSLLEWLPVILPHGTWALLESPLPERGLDLVTCFLYIDYSKTDVTSFLRSGCRRDTVDETPLHIRWGGH